MQKKITDFLECLPVLVENRVDFIIVGGVCAVLHGTPVTTFDLDIVHSRTPENLERLMMSLKDMDAYYRGRPGKRLTPDTDCLSSPSHHLLMTRFGPLDVLGTIGNGHSYDDLVTDTETLHFDRMKLQILRLERLIEIKEETAHDKDLLVISVLRSILEEKQHL
ncbi:hypothetical protein DENIS_4358 [Desulfonema ishimotonii]|uniref:Nucleotidyltransferase n=1 Tax=Desulfonema ishimotonii TaxID=45657 RepID=A0A401G2B8_9BACT|nr:hypothetical protein [Desulfonema ishimotonii]GBC63364.1 hypothetical protein DENIS_4358 [Desulfonema ishimotonii]